jgi:hypothetical protein
MLATLHFFKTLASAALWFFSGGIAMALTGALNLLNRALGQAAAYFVQWTIVGIVIGLIYKPLSTA